jgi:hypothetical protein
MEHSDVAPTEFIPAFLERLFRLFPSILKKAGMWSKHTVGYVLLKYMYIGSYSGSAVMNTIGYWERVNKHTLSIIG